jgi:hypothetical protein
MFTGRELSEDQVKRIRVVREHAKEFALAIYDCVSDKDMAAWSVDSIHSDAKRAIASISDE